MGSVVRMRYLLKTISYVKLCEYVGGRLKVFCCCCVTPLLGACGVCQSATHVQAGRQAGRLGERFTSFNAGTGISRAEKYKYQKHLTTKLHENLYMNAPFPPTLYSSAAATGVAVQYCFIHIGFSSNKRPMRIKRGKEW